MSDKNTTSKHPPDVEREEFAALFSRNARRIYAFIMTLVMNHHDAEEVFQNTSIVLWDKYDELKPRSNFVAWANRVAYLEVLNYRKRKRRRHALHEKALSVLADEAAAFSEQTNHRQRALTGCLEKLGSQDRSLIEERYYYQRSPREIATHKSRSLHSVYRALGRIHDVLLDCVQRSLAQEEAT